MDILLYNYEYPPLGGGAGRASAQIAAYLVRRGHRVRVVTSAWARRAAGTDSNGVEVIALPALRTRVGESDLVQMSAYVASACGWTLGNLARLRGCVGLVFFGLPSGPPALLLRTLARVPYVVSLRGGDVPGFRKGAPPGIVRALSPLLRLIWRAASRVIANSESLAELARKFEPGGPIDVIPNGVDTERFRPREGPREAGPLRIVSVGRMQEQKGFDLLIRAVAQLPRGMAELTIVGDGPLRRSLERLARDDGVVARCPGWLDSTGVAEELRRADVFSLLSHDEGMSNALLEAMSSGLAPVCSDLPSNRSVLDTELAAASLVPPGAITETAQRLKALASDPRARHELARRARARAAQFSWSVTCSEYERILGGVSGHGDESLLNRTSPVLPSRRLEVHRGVH